MNCDLVIFDCDGVLVDSELLSVRADVACLAEDGIEVSPDEVLARYTGISLAAMVADLEARHGRLLPDFAARHQRRLEALFTAELRAMAGIEAVIDSLPCRCCVASSSSPERLRLALSLVGLFDRLHPDIFSATMVARGKPAPDLFLQAAAQMGVAPAACVVVEDSPPGIAAAGAAGMTAIGFCGGSHCRRGHAEKLRQGGARLVIDRLDRLLPALSAL